MAKESKWRGVRNLLGIALFCGAVVVSETFGWTEIGSRRLGITQLESVDERQGLPTMEQRVYGISQVWKQAADYYGSWGLADDEISWDEAYEVAYQEAIEASSAKEYYLVIRKFLAHLNTGASDSVSGVSNKGWARLPFLMEQRNGEYVVISTQDIRNFPLGSVVTRVNGMETGAYLEGTWGEYVGIQTPIARENQLCYVFAIAGEADEKVELEIRKPGADQTESVKASWAMNVREFQNESYTVPGTPGYSSDIFTVTKLEGNLMYFSMKHEMDLDSIDEYFNKVVPILAESDGVIFDLRKNRTGGNSAIGHTIVESFMGSEIPECTGAPNTLKASEYTSVYGAWSNAAKRSTEQEWSVFSELFEENADVYGEQFQVIMELGQEMHEGRFEVTEEMQKLLDEEAKRRLGGKVFEESFDSLWLDDVENSQVMGKPMVMVVNSKIGSSNDSTAAVAKAAGVPLVGTRTRGSTGNVLLIDAGGGWYAAITTQRALTPEGVDINNNVSDE